MMDLKVLYTFYTIAKEGSFSKAAKKLSYTKSTITVHVGQLETELGTQLFERIGRRMVLTKAGVQLIPYVEEVFDALRRMEGFRDDIANYTGNLRIGAPESLLCFRLPPVFREFQKRAPKTSLSLFSMNSTSVRMALKEGNIDVGIFYDNDMESEPNLIFEPLEKYQLILASSPLLKKKYKDQGKGLMADVKVPKIVQPNTGSVRKKFNEYMKKHGILEGNTIEIRSTQTIINLAKNDMGVCFLPKFVLQEELDKKSLVQIPLHEGRVYISSSAAYYKNKWVSPALSLFLELLKNKEIKNSRSKK